MAEVDWPQRLYEAAGGNLEGLLEMWHDDQQRTLETRSPMNFAEDIPEVRSVDFTDLESSNDGWSFRGTAVVYGQVADLGGWTEEFARGSVRRQLAADGNTRMIYDHSPPHVPVLATVRGKTLSMKEIPNGVEVRADIARHYIGEAARELVKRGDIKGMSLGMIVGAGNSRMEHRGSKPHRVITDLKQLLEVSLTPDPAYSGTSAEFRALRAIQMAESLDLAQQVSKGTYQQHADGAQVEEVDTDTDEATTDVCEHCQNEECTCNPDPEVEGEVVGLEQRAGVSPADEAAARRRRLHMMGLTLPKDDITRSMSPDDPETRRRPVGNVQDILLFPRETWSGEEHRAVQGRLKHVQTELFEIAGKAERAGRTLNAEEAQEFDRLQTEFQQLRA